MARTVAVEGGVGVLLGVVGAVGWHFQPVLASFGPPRPFYQVLHAADGPLYSGFMPKSALSRRHAPSWFPALALPALGALAGLAFGTAPEHRAAPGARARRRTIPTAALGLFVGTLSALARHLDPSSSSGAPWNGVLFWPVDLGYPTAGLLLGLVLGLVLGLIDRVRSRSAGTPGPV